MMVHEFWSNTMPSKRLPWWCVPAVLAVWLSLMVTPSVRANEILIDDFTFATTPPYVWYCLTATRDDLDYTEFTDTDPGGSIIGQEREARIQLNGSPRIMSAAGFIGVYKGPPDEGKMEFGSRGRDPATSAKLTYNGVGSNGLGGLDLTDGGTNNGFLLHFDHVNGVEPDGLSLDIKVTKTNGGALIYADHHVPNDPGTVKHPVAFDDFRNLDGTLALPSEIELLFSNVDSIEFWFNLNYTANVDFGLLSVKAVPEPSTLALLGLGVFILVVQQGCRRRRRYKNRYLPD